MNFNELIVALQYGDLSAHGMFAMELSEQNKERLKVVANQAATDLYTRFPLLDRELTLIQRDGRATYPLREEFAYTYTDPRRNNWFIFDSKFEPFTGDVIKINYLCDETGDEWKYNSIDQCCKSFFTTSPDVIEFPAITADNAVFVNYRASHPRITEDTPIIVPANWLPAFYALIASKIYAGGTSQEHVAKSTEMMQKYEMYCTQQQGWGMANDDMYGHGYKFQRDGWM